MTTRPETRRPALIRPPGRRALRRVGLALAALGLVGGVRWGVAAPMTVSSHSMAPTLSPGQVLLVSRWRPEPGHGDLVVFDEPGSGGAVVKRVVGLPGERLVVRDSVLYVDERPQTEPWVDHHLIDGYYSQTYVVPPGRVFVLGDNRGNSVDSRDYGAIAVDSLLGAALVSLWPPGPWAERGRPPKP